MRTKYKIVGDAQALEQDSDHHITFLLANYKCEPPNPGAPQVIAVYMSLWERAPNFNGMSVTTIGSFNPHDGSFGATSISVPQIGYKASTYDFGWTFGLVLVAVGIFFIGIGVFACKIDNSLGLHCYMWICEVIGAILVLCGCIYAAWTLLRRDKKLKPGT